MGWRYSAPCRSDYACDEDYEYDLDLYDSAVDDRCDMLEDQRMRDSQ